MGVFKNVAIELNANTSTYELAMERLLVSENKIYELAIDGLRSANKKSVFWSKSDAMQLLNLVRKNAIKEG